MKTLPVGLAAHIAGGTTTLADLLKITRTDGTVFAFTSAANDVTISSVLYKSAQGLNISSLEASAGLNVDNLELSTLDDGTVFTKLDVLSGRWLNADFVISRYNWSNPADGVDVRMVGTIGEVRLHRGYVTAELRGLQQYLQQPIGSVSSKTCRARLGDALCTKDITSFTHAVTVDTSANPQSFIMVVSGSAPGDTYWNSVVLAMHMNGTNGSTVFTDVRGKTVTANGDAQISTTQSKFSGASAYFDGTGDYLSTPDSADFNFAAGDYTVEMFVYASATVSATKILVGQWGTTNLGWNVIVSGTNKVGLETSTDGTYSAPRDLLSANNVFSINTWFHLAITRYGDLYSLWVDGANVGNLTIVGALFNSPTQLTIGANETGANAFNGYIDDLRITKGIARYTTTFTPPTAEFLEVLPSIGAAYSDGYFDNGIATFTSGANINLSQKIKTFASNTFTLSLPMLASIAPGDELTVVAGCQKRLSDCSTKFSNVLNFQGEPHLPGIDQVVQ